MGIQRELGWKEGYSNAMDNIIEEALPSGTVEDLEERKSSTESYNDVIVRELNLKGEETCLTNEQFRALLDLLMVSDPWPLEEEDHETVTGLLKDESEARGFDEWSVAYHEFEP